MAPVVSDNTRVCRVGSGASTLWAGSFSLKLIQLWQNISWSKQKKKSAGAFDYQRDLTPQQIDGKCSLVNIKHSQAEKGICFVSFILIAKIFPRCTSCALCGFSKAGSEHTQQCNRNDYFSSLGYCRKMLIFSPKTVMPCPVERYNKLWELLNSIVCT